MTRKRSRIDDLRAPFVVTVALTTGACGGTVTERSGEPTEGNGGTENGGASSGGAVNGGTSSAGGSGGWGTGGIGNPPPPTDQCPTIQPVNGSTCDYAGTTPCGYSPECGSYYEATCVGRTAFGGTWDVQFMPSSCNPPPVMCPATEPVAGTPCDGPLGSALLDCVYCGGDCLANPEKHFQCTPGANGTWAWVLSHVYGSNPPPPPYDAGSGSGGAPSYDAGAALPPAD